MHINLDYLNRCIATLENAYRHLQDADPNDILYDIYRAACVKEFELVLEQSGKLLKKRISVYFASNKVVDKLSFKEIFRQAVMHTLIDIDTVERWLAYRDNRNNTAHDYGEEFAETTLKLLPQFIIDAKALSLAIAESQTDD
ncbi:MAG: HI0074 family nucleotidyltransferase substrate-binding subunit [Pseudanabaena sp. ELA748]